MNRTALSCAFTSASSLAQPRETDARHHPRTASLKKQPITHPSPGRCGKQPDHAHTHTHTRMYIQAGRAGHGHLVKAPYLLSRSRSAHTTRSPVLACLLPRDPHLPPILVCLAYLVLSFLPRQAGRQGPSSPSSQNQKSKRGGRDFASASASASLHVYLQYI